MKHATLAANMLETFDDNTEPHVYAVSELTRAIKGVLAETFDEVWVEGEISGIRIPQSGHAYFTLKDDAAQLPCVMWRAQRSKLRFDIEDGQQMLCRGRLNVYEPQGKYQLYVERLEPKGWGALQLAFEQLKEKLFKEGLFDEARKQPLPAFPQRVAIITSGTGDAVHDVLRHLDHARIGVHALVYPVRVQGDGAAAEMATAIHDLNRLHTHLPIDVIVVGRGGGSKEDLWAYNEEVLARAIAASAIPIMTGIGHTEDCTIADLVADIYANTPTNAADRIREHKLAAMNTMLTLVDRASRAINNQLKDTAHRLELLSTHYVFRRPMELLDEWRQRVDEWHRRAAQIVQHRLGLQQRELHGVTGRVHALNPRQQLAGTRDRLTHLQSALDIAVHHTLQGTRSTTVRLIGQLDVLSPLAILARGYSVTYTDTPGQLLKQVCDAQVGSRIRTRLVDGVVVSRVETTEQDVLRTES